VVVDTWQVGGERGGGGGVRGAVEGEGVVEFNAAVEQNRPRLETL